jgi:hypothetical protein
LIGNDTAAAGSTALPNQRMKPTLLSRFFVRVVLVLWRFKSSLVKLRKP